MLTIEDKQWLQKQYSKLTVDSNEISGVVYFVATFNRQNGNFQILKDGLEDEVGGCRLSGSFNIHIQDRSDKSLSNLPAVHVDNIETIAARHFNQSDKTACLCSPFEEEEFLNPQFQFQLFLEKLVIPFLYGQLFYNIEGRWPWQEYAHGVTGLLESYSRTTNPAKVRECLLKLSRYKDSWPRIRSALEQKSYIKGHTSCFCPKMDHIKRCHPLALKGILQLQTDIKEHGIIINSVLDYNI